MNLKKITIIQIGITALLAIILLFVFNFKVSLGLILGSAVGYFNFYSMNKRISLLTDEEIPNIKKIVKKNRNFRMLVLISVLVIAGLIPELFNIIATCLGVLINQVVIRINLSKK